MRTGTAYRKLCHKPFGHRYKALGQLVTISHHPRPFLGAVAMLRHREGHELTNQLLRKAHLTADVEPRCCLAVRFVPAGHILFPEVMTMHGFRIANFDVFSGHVACGPHFEQITPGVFAQKNRCLRWGADFRRLLPQRREDVIHRPLLVKDLKTLVPARLCSVLPKKCSWKRQRLAARFALVLDFVQNILGNVLFEVSLKDCLYLLVFPSWFPYSLLGHHFPQPRQTLQEAPSIPNKLLRHAALVLLLVLQGGWI